MTYGLPEAPFRFPRPEPMSEEDKRDREAVWNMPPIAKVTRYQPQHADGRKGPVFGSATEAALWIMRRPERGWEWKPV